MLYLYIAVTFAIVDLWLFFLYIIYQKQKSSGEMTNGPQIRGIIKFYYKDELPPKIRYLVKIWLLVFVALFIVAYFWVFYFTWNTDYNFLIAVYPFAWHYMFFRYFLWEKEDLIDNPTKK